MHTFSTSHLCIQSPLELQHVGILLWVDMVIGEDHRQPIHRQSAWGERRGWGVLWGKGEGLTSLCWLVSVLRLCCSFVSTC